MPYACTVHPDTAAVALFTTLYDGESINLCRDCVHPFAAQLAADTAPAATEPAPEPDPEPDPGTPAERFTEGANLAMQALQDAAAPDAATAATGPDPDGDEDEDEEPGFAASTIAAALSDTCEVCRGRDGQHVQWCAAWSEQREAAEAAERDQATQDA